jgi:hypothetical protein
MFLKIFSQASTGYSEGGTVRGVVRGYSEGVQ